jgi:hypothetical protein
MSNRIKDTKTHKLYAFRAVYVIMATLKTPPREARTAARKKAHEMSKVWK